MTDAFERLDIHLNQDITTQSEAEVDDDEMTEFRFVKQEVDVGPINGETGIPEALLNALKAKMKADLKLSSAYAADKSWKVPIVMDLMTLPKIFQMYRANIH